MVKDERELKAEGNAQHQEEWEMRRAHELPEESRQNPKQCERAQHQTDERLEDRKQEECGHPDALPEKPREEPDDISGTRCPLPH